MIFKYMALEAPKMEKIRNELNGPKTFWFFVFIIVLYVSFLFNVLFIFLLKLRKLTKFRRSVPLL